MTVKYLLDVDRGIVTLRFSYNELFLKKIKNIQGRKFDPANKTWIIPEESFYDLMETVDDSIYFVDERRVLEQENAAADPVLENAALPRNESGYLPEGKIYISWETKDALRLDFNYCEDFIKFVKALPGSSYIPEDKAWRVPKKAISTLQKHYAPATFVFLGAGMDQFKYQVPPFSLKLTPLPEDMRFKTEPFSHQKEALSFALSHPKCLIGDEQGLGKTWVAINAMTLRKTSSKKCLIVCGVNTVKYNWKNEIKIHSNEESILIDGANSQKRVKRIAEWLESDAYFGIINIEALRSSLNLSALVEAVKEERIGAIIVDEIHKAKNPRSIQGKSLVHLKPFFRIGLSGTPINKPEELWNVLTWLEIENQKEYPWKRRYCVFGGYQSKLIVAYKNHVELRDKLQKCMIRRRKDDVLDLPPKLYQKQYVELTSRQKEIYDDALSGLIIDYDKIIQLNNPLTETLRLRQITGGMFTESNPKLDRVKELLSEEIIPSGHKAIIFSNWRKTTDIYYEALKDYDPAYINGTTSGPARDVEALRFQTDDNCKIIIGTIGAMGTGITLNKASYVIFIDQSWVPLDNEQAEDRAHRIGAKGTVTIINLIAKDTIDEYIEEHNDLRREAFSYFVESGGVNPKKAREIFTDFIKSSKE